MKIPNAEDAVVDIRKLHDYCLNEAHPKNKHKARVFAAALGLTANDAELLKSALLDAVQNDTAMLGEKDAYGQRYRIDFTMIGDKGQEVAVRSSWIVRTNEGFPRLTTCYVI